MILGKSIISDVSTPTRRAGRLYIGDASWETANTVVNGAVAQKLAVGHTKAKEIQPGGEQTRLSLPSQQNDSDRSRSTIGSST